MSLTKHLQGVAVTLALFLLVGNALFFFGCATAKPEPQEREHPSVNVAPAVPPALPAPGFFLSTPEGSARRQARKDSRAAVPRSIGKGAVYAPKAEKVVNGGNKSKGPTSNADSGAAVNNAAENSQQQNANGDGNQLEATKKDVLEEAPGFWASFLGPTGYVVAGLLVLVVVVFLIRRKARNSIPFIG